MFRAIGKVIRPIMCILLAILLVVLAVMPILPAMGNMQSVTVGQEITLVPVAHSSDTGATALFIIVMTAITVIAMRYRRIIQAYYIRAKMPGFTQYAITRCYDGGVLLNCPLSGG